MARNGQIDCFATGEIQRYFMLLFMLLTAWGTIIRYMCKQSFISLVKDKYQSLGAKRKRAERNARVKQFWRFNGSEKAGVEYYKFLILRSGTEQNKKSKMNITRIKILGTKLLF